MTMAEKIRVGISTGEVNIDERGDVFGDAVNIAARIEGFADPNGVFIAESTYLAMNKSEVNAMDLGPQQFKNVMQEIRVYRIMGDQISMSPLQTKEQKNTLPSSYKHLGIGLACGVLLAMVFILILMPLAMNVINQQMDRRHEVKETGISSAGIESGTLPYDEPSFLRPDMDREQMDPGRPDTESSLSLDKSETTFSNNEQVLPICTVETSTVDSRFHGSRCFCLRIIFSAKLSRYYAI